MTASGTRHTAREYALRLLYTHEQQRLLGESVQRPVAPNWWEDDDRLNISPESERFGRELMQTVLQKQDIIDQMIQQQAKHWRLERMPLVDRNILRLSIGELMMPHPTPVQVVLNEAIELAKCYGDVDSPKFVNGILDPLAKQLSHPNETPESTDTSETPSSP